MKCASSSVFFAHLPTSLGGLVMASNGQALTGLYFSDQRDCPPVGRISSSGTTAPGIITDPTAGEIDGRGLRNVRIAGRRTNQVAQLPNLGAGLAKQLHAGALHALGPTTATAPAQAIFEWAAQELDAYFAGTLTRFSVPLQLEGTPFQQKVWQALIDIPHSALVSYGDVARAVGDKAASRAVGVAVGRNPVSVIVPCHRVVAANRRLTGYGGGLHRKCSLLSHEGWALA